MNTRIYKRRMLFIVGVVAIALLVGSCREPVGGMGRSPVFLTTSPGDATWPLHSDVYTPTVVGKVTDDAYKIEIKSTYKNPNLTSTFADVYLNEYRVTFYRLDGSTNVPEPFVIHFTGLVPAGGSYTHDTLIIRREAKLMSPLVDLAFGGGEGTIYFNAVIEFYGEDLMGNHVSTSYTLLVHAADL